MSPRKVCRSIIRNRRICPVTPRRLLVAIWSEDGRRSIRVPMDGPSRHAVRTNICAKSSNLIGKPQSTLMGQRLVLPHLVWVSQHLHLVRAYLVEFPGS